MARSNQCTHCQLDSAVLKGILKAHSKTPTEFLHLETGTLPLRWVIAQRRINYLRHIMSRENDEIIKKVFLAHKENPTRGDFVHLVEKDVTDFEVTYENVSSGELTKTK